uniref:Putative inositol polyphosphate 5-phosphatase n=1 Tax=Ixodes ricinus TaxID=34613 RepID=A0A147BG75_IXORI
MDHQGPCRKEVESSPKRPSRLAFKHDRIKGTKKSQSLPVIKTPLDDLRLVADRFECAGKISKGSVGSLNTHPIPRDILNHAISSSEDEDFHPANSSPGWDDDNLGSSDPLLKQTSKAKTRLARLSSLVKCPSSSSLNRPLGFATEQLLWQTSCMSTGSLKSLSSHDGVGGFDAGRPHHLPPLATTGSPSEAVRRATESKRLQHSWTVTGVSQFQDSFDQPVDKPSVLPKITTKDARLRSYLVGNVSGKGSLLGEEELSRYFPDRKVHVFVATWNMNGLAPPPNLDDLMLPETIEHVPDIYAIGVQESMSDKKEWETKLQFTLGPSHVLFYSVSLGVLHLSIFLRRDLLWFCSAPEEATHATRPVSAVKTKGAVAIAFQFFGSSMLFINSHLTAHDKKFKERIQDYERICHQIDLPKQAQLKLQYQSKDVTARFDLVFWCGDLNFRIMNERETVVNLLRDPAFDRKAVYESLLRFDQLKSAMSEGQAFFGFQEAGIGFGPTYKFQVGFSLFDGVKLRVPSYTDRILFRSKRKGHIECVCYNAITVIQTSDHRPVYGLYEAQIRAGRDNTRLAAGLFNREIYLEGMVTLPHSLHMFTACGKFWHDLVCAHLSLVHFV